MVSRKENKVIELEIGDGCYIRGPAEWDGSDLQALLPEDDWHEPDTELLWLCLRQLDKDIARIKADRDEWKKNYMEVLHIYGEEGGYGVLI